MRVRSRAAVLDTNLLLLWLAGNVDLTLLRSFKRIQDFSAEDYEILRSTVRRFDHLWTTPHVLTETSNFTGQAPPYRRDQLRAALASYIEVATEVASRARDLTRRPEFPSLGLTDAGLGELAATATVLTVDYRLYARIEVEGGSCINFNHLRSSART